MQPHTEFLCVRSWVLTLEETLWLRNFSGSCDDTGGCVTFGRCGEEPHAADQRAALQSLRTTALKATEDRQSEIRGKTSQLAFAT